MKSDNESLPLSDGWGVCRLGRVELGGELPNCNASTLWLNFVMKKREKNERKVNLSRTDYYPVNSIFLWLIDCHLIRK